MDRLTAIRSLQAAALIGVVAQAVLFRTALGLNGALLTAGCLGAALVIASRAGRVRRIDPADAWIPVAALIVATMLAVRSDPMLMFLNGITAATLLGASMAAFAGVGVTRQSALAIAGLGLLVFGWMCVGILRVTALARRPENAPARRMRLPATSIPILRGLLMATPILVVFVVLFASADPIFATLTANLFDWQLDLGELPVRAGLAFLVAWAVAGLLGVAAGGIDLDRAAVPPMQSLGAAVAEPLPVTPRLGVTEAVTVLVAVVILFTAFVLLQVAYLFGGLDTLAAGGITYASYARRGFFELVAVTCLAGGLVVGLHAVVAQRTRAFLGAAIALALLNIVILVSAAYRLRLYQEAYGWTELRFYIYATIAWLLIGIVATVVLLARDRMRWLVHAMTISAVGVLVVVNLIGPQRHVAEQNVARLLNPSLVPADGRTGLDLDYAASLGGVDAVPALVAALPALGTDDQAMLLTELDHRWRELRRPEVTAWPAWNVARERAREALEPLFGQ